MSPMPDSLRIIDFEHHGPRIGPGDSTADPEGTDSLPWTILGQVTRLRVVNTHDSTLNAFLMKLVQTCPNTTDLTLRLLRNSSRPMDLRPHSPSLNLLPHIPSPLHLINADIEINDDESLELVIKLLHASKSLTSIKVNFIDAPIPEPAEASFVERAGLQSLKFPADQPA